MITNSKFLCPNCNKEDYQKVLFLNRDFQYQCGYCNCYHLFHHNESNKIKNNMVLYIGTITESSEWIIKNTSYCRNNIDYENQNKSFVLFESLLKNINHQQKNIDTVQKCKISNKLYLKQPIFIANAIPNSHFQECLRAVVRTKEHLLSENSGSFYNILIKDKITDLCLNPLSKLEGIDEIWEIHDTSNNVNLSIELTKYLDSYDSQAMCISKKAGPTKYGTELIKNLLKPIEYKKLFTTNQQTLSDKYMAITVRGDHIGGRAGLDDPDELQNLCSIISLKGFIPVVIACTESEIKICSQLRNPDIKVLIATSLEDQIVFYSSHCYGGIGTNGSCCNIPSLFNLPMFILARERPFPDDFYCFGRLISPYIEDHPYNGELWKPDNIIEYQLGDNEKTSISRYDKELNDWLYGLSKNILYGRL